MAILRFDWKAFDAVAGVKYASGVAIVIALSAVAEFSWFAAGLSALLTWLTNVPGLRRDRVGGVLVYIVGAVALVGLAHALRGTYWPWLVAMLVVAFLGTFAMIRGPRGFMVGWCLIAWFYAAPLLGAAEAPGELLAAHLLGSGVLLLLIALPTSRSRGDGEAAQAEDTSSAECPDLGFVTRYSATVGLVMSLSLALGDAWLKTDPTLIMNAALMVLMPSARKTWTVAVDRVIGALSGVIVGFYLGQFAHGPILEVVLWIVASFFVVALLNVNAGAVIFFFVLTFAESWGALGGETGHTMANERVVAEIVGALVAGVAVSVKHVLESRVPRTRRS